jgi:LCP family protein required for cell wall assembly
VPRTKRASLPERAITRPVPGPPPGVRPPGRQVTVAELVGPTAPRLPAAFLAAPRRYDPDDFRRFDTLRPALLTTAAATVVPGLGHLVLRRFRTGAAIVAAFLFGLVALLVVAARVDRAALLGGLLSSRVLIGGALFLVVAALAWMAVIIRTYVLARPRELRTEQRAVGVAVVAALCLTVALPLGFGAELANSQRQLINRLFPALGGGTPAAEAIGKARLNVLLVGSDAGPDRRGARTDTMMVASIDTKSGRTILFGLPRNIQRAQFPPGSAMAKRFPQGFHNPADPLSGDYLLNAVYGYAHTHPEVAPAGPTRDPGLNLLHSSVATMLGLQLDYYVEVNMAGFAAIIDALGGLTVDLGPDPLPVGGITPSGKHVRPDRFLPTGVQHLNGTDALAFARSRTYGDDYQRMGRQRCLLQYLLQQKSPADVLTNFQAVAAATTNSVSTNIPQGVLPALVSVADKIGTGALESVSFDPNLADPGEPDGRFDTSHPDFAFMKKVVRDTIAGPPPAAAPSTAAAAQSAAAPTSAAKPQAGAASAVRSGPDGEEPTTRPAPTSGSTSLAQAC